MTGRGIGQSTGTARRPFGTLQHCWRGTPAADADRLPALPDSGSVALTRKQQAFVDAYTGNGTAAARAAGYRGTDNALGVQAHELLRSPKILEALKNRGQDLPASTRAAVTQAVTIATRAERQAFWTQTMLDVEADLGHRLRAAELLGKSEADFTEKLLVDAKLTLEDLLKKAGA